MNDILATTYLGIGYKKFKKHGVFDPILNRDSPFFINVIRLKKAKTPEFAHSYEKINQYFDNIAMILNHADKKDKTDRFYREAVKRFEVFHEVNGINLGFADSASGAGFGSVLSHRVIFDAYDIIKSGTKDPELFHLIGLFEDNVGPDRLSDMIGTIILQDIQCYTRRVMRELGITPTKYPNERFDDDGFLVNPFKQCRMYFLPEEILHELPVAACWEDIDKVITENNAIRRELNVIIGSSWHDWVKSTAASKKSLLKRVIFENPEVCRRIIDSYRNSDLDDLDFKKDIDYCILKLWQVIQPQINFLFLQHSDTQIDSMTGAKMAIEIFQDWVENNGGWKIIQELDSAKREKGMQRLIHLAAKQFISDNNLDFSCEPDDGHGPVDFKVSRGQDKTVIELKLSSNSQYLHGYKVQIQQYAKSEKTQNMIYIFVDVGNPGRRKKLEELIEEDQLSDGIFPETIIIDATEQRSASNW
ncbi:MAG: hypothetical protein ACSW8J_00380 [bacterium]